jgi:hypothetical protein
MAGTCNSDHRLSGHRSLGSVGGDNRMGPMNNSVVFDRRLKKSGSQYRESKTGRFLPRREAEDQRKPKGTACMGCGIMVGDGYMETQLHQVGNYQICGSCRRQLEKRGRLWVQPYNQYLYLYPDGRVVIKTSALRGDEDEAEGDQVAGRY